MIAPAMVPPAPPAIVERVEARREDELTAELRALLVLLSNPPRIDP